MGRIWNDRYEWVELLSTKPDGQAVTCEFVKINDENAIDRWRHRFGNTDVFQSICIYAEPNRDARYAVPMYFSVCEKDLPSVQKSTLELAKQVLIETQCSLESLQVYFDGHQGFDLAISHQDMDTYYSPHAFKLYRGMAQAAAQAGIMPIRSDIYSEAFRWRLPNSIDSRSRLYKTEMTLDVLDTAEMSEILEDSRIAQPRGSLLGALWSTEKPFAAWWFEREIKKLTTNPGECTHCNHSSDRSTSHVRLPACIASIESAVLSDGVRHQTYLSLAKYFAHLNLHHTEIVQRLMAIDVRNPIRDPDDIQELASFGCLHPGFSCRDPVYQTFCQREICWFEDKNQA